MITLPLYVEGIEHEILAHEWKIHVILLLNGQRSRNLNDVTKFLKYSQSIKGVDLQKSHLYKKLEE